MAIPFALWLAASPETLFLAWLFVSPLIANYFSVHPIAGFTPDRLVLTVLGVRIAAGAAMSIERHGQEGRGRVLLSVLLVAYILAELLGSLHGPGGLSNQLAAYADRAFLPAVALVIGLTFALHHGPAYVDRLLQVLCGVGLVAVLVEVLRPYGGIDHFIYPYGRAFVWNDVGGQRAAGEFYNPAIFGAIVALSMALLLFMDWETAHPWRRWALYACCTWAAAVSYTRSVWLCYAAVIALFFVFGRRKLDRVAIFVALVLAGAGIVLVVPPDVLSTFANRLSEVGDVQSRAQLNSELWQQFSATPLLGAGAGWFDSVHQIRLFDIGSGRMTLPPAHNSLLLMLADRGLLAFVPWAFILMYSFAASVQLYRTGTLAMRRVMCAFWSMAAIYLVSANTIEVEFFSYFIDLWWILMGVTIGLWWRVTSEPESGPVARASMVSNHSMVAGILPSDLARRP
jgi:O-antigen ligase